MKKMNRRRSSLWLAIALFLLLPFQNCGQSFTTIDGAAVLSSVQDGNNGSTTGSSNTPADPTPESTPTTTTTMPAGGTPVAPCVLAQVGNPVMVPSTVTTVQSLSGKGPNGGRVPSVGVTFQYSQSNAPSNCQQTVAVQCSQITSNVTALNGSGVRVPTMPNDINCVRTGGTTPGSTGSISFSAFDNDTTKQCMEGTATYEISLRSTADPSKFSSRQTLTVNFKNNCYPEQVSAESLDSFDQMGTAVAVDGGVAAVLAPGDDGDSNQTQSIGAIYIYKRGSDGKWSKTQVLRTDDTAIVSDRGAAGDTPASIALKNGVLVVGSEFNNNYAGAAFVFKSSNGTFSLARKLSGQVAGGRFGRAVAVDGSQIAVGAPGESSSKGAVHIFDAGSYSETAQISSPLAANSYFGAAVAIEGTLLAVGAPASTLYRDTMTGELLVYRKSTSWAEVTTNPLRANSTKTGIAVKDPTGKDTAITIALGAELGASVAISNGVVIVGAPGQMTLTKKTGLAIVMASDLKSLQTLTDFSGSEGRFGAAVALGSAGAFVGGPELRTRGGAVDHFALNSGIYKFVRRVSSVTGADNDQFGFSVATSGNDVVVGAKLNAEPNNSSGSASFFSTIVP
jgi:hypothetical protein